jgi:hypothetical protein
MPNSASARAITAPVNPAPTINTFFAFFSIILFS